MITRPSLSSLELCAGAGGQALGLEMAGFEPRALVEIDTWACATLKTNRPRWNVVECDLHTFDAVEYQGVDLVAAGVPCPPFSIAGKQLGEDDDRDLFPQALRIVAEAKPRSVLIENVRGLLGPAFDSYRAQIQERLQALGYVSEWRLVKRIGLRSTSAAPKSLAGRHALVELFPVPVAGGVGDSKYNCWRHSQRGDGLARLARRR